MFILFKQKHGFLIIFLRWYHASIGRKEAERLLMESSNPRGCFLIRDSETVPGKLIFRFYLIYPLIYSFSTGAFSLSVRDYEDRKGDHVKHYKIKNLDNGQGCYIAPRRTFSSLKDLVDHYSCMLSR